MQPSEQQLRAHFADLSDEALLQAGLHTDDLTAVARDVLRSEVEGRHLLVLPNEPPGPEPPAWDDQRIVSIRRFRDFSEAIVARSALESASIPCFLRNENTVRIDWQISNAIGGIRLDVLESDVAAAEAVLLPVDADTGVGASSDLVCPTCGSADIRRKHPWGGWASASILMFGIPLSRGRREWTCDRCSTHWTDEE